MHKGGYHEMLGHGYKNIKAEIRFFPDKILKIILISPIIYLQFPLTNGPQLKNMAKPSAVFPFMPLPHQKLASPLRLCHNFFHN